MGGPGEQGAARGEGGVCGGAGCRVGIGCQGDATAVPTHALVHGIRGRGVGDGLRSLLSLTLA